MFNKKQTRISCTQTPLRFKHFSRKGYALFSVLGREVLIGVLSVATVSHAKAEGISIIEENADKTLQQKEIGLGEVVVTGSRAPLTQAEAAKIVSVITREDIDRAAAESVNDLLKQAIGVDVRQRGGFGVQTDISINGGTFDQIAILLNGVNISNPQTGHLSADFPVTLDDIERIEIIEGAAARVYGASAFNGAVNIVTKEAPIPGPSPLEEEGRSYKKHDGSVSLEGGSYGTFGAAARGALSIGRYSQSLSGSYKQSDGGTDNSYFRKGTGYYQGRYGFSERTSLGCSFAVSGMNYGANTFYSAKYPNQYESNARLLASLDLEHHTEAYGLTVKPYWNRSYDHFQLIKDSTSGENFHRTDVLGLQANAYINYNVNANLNMRTAVGMEIRKEKILSTNLGVPTETDVKVPHYDIYYNKEKGRTDVNFFLEHNILLKKFTASLGVVANKNTGYNNGYRLYPGVDVSYRPTEAWKIVGSWNMAFRMPTFTNLFYNSPTNEGNKDLRPEKSNTLKVGVRYSKPVVTLDANAFYCWGTDMIDWVMYSADDKYHSANLRLDNRGYEVTVKLNPFITYSAIALKTLSLKAGYAYIDQKRYDDFEIYQSYYAMEYLRHKFTADIYATVYQPKRSGVSTPFHRTGEGLGIGASFRRQWRMGGYAPVSLLDAKVQWKALRYELALAANNIFSKQYYDIGHVLQPGFWMMASAKWKF